MSRVTLTQYLVEQQRAKGLAPADVRQLIEDVGRACKGIASAINKGALAGVLHFLWLVKSDIREPLLYGGILLTLMLFRAVVWMQKKRR